MKIHENPRGQGGPSLFEIQYFSLKVYNGKQGTQKVFWKMLGRRAGFTTSSFLAKKHICGRLHMKKQKQHNLETP